jgi:hypothetical protein
MKNERVCKDSLARDVQYVCCRFDHLRERR